MGLLINQLNHAKEKYFEAKKDNSSKRMILWGGWYKALRRIIEKEKRKKE